MQDDLQSTITALFEEYAEGIYRYASFLLRSSIDASDVVQEVFLRAYRSWNTFREGSTVRTWLYQIAKNCAYDMLRKQSKEKSVKELASLQGSSVSQIESMVEYEELFETLPVKYRETLVLHVMEGFTLGEVSMITGCSPTTARVRYYRARHRMRELINNSYSNQLSEEKSE